MGKHGASQHGGDLYACCDGGLYSSARVQKAARSHSNCNPQRRRSIKLTQFIQLARHHPPTRQPCSSTCGKGFNTTIINTIIGVPSTRGVRQGGIERLQSQNIFSKEQNLASTHAFLPKSFTLPPHSSYCLPLLPTAGSSAD